MQALLLSAPERKPDGPPRFHTDRFQIRTASIATAQPDALSDAPDA
jgi:hypothetical protein